MSTSSKARQLFLILSRPHGRFPRLPRLRSMFPILSRPRFHQFRCNMSTPSRKHQSSLTLFRPLRRRSRHIASTTYQFTLLLLLLQSTLMSFRPLHRRFRHIVSRTCRFTPLLFQSNLTLLHRRIASMTYQSMLLRLLPSTLTLLNRRMASKKYQSTLLLLLLSTPTLLNRRMAPKTYQSMLLLLLLSTLTLLHRRMAPKTYQSTLLLPLQSSLKLFRPLHRRLRHTGSKTHRFTFLLLLLRMKCHPLRWSLSTPSRLRRLTMLCRPW
ncbi:hypothetical protein F4782DRAFT_487906 [Xylaria castorea]|nr:hypothetical protein F4782DRAFT_487906 [Xylaria castorea]